MLIHTPRRALAGISALLAALLAPSLALAHHAMDGQTPVTWGQGFLSGLAHPVIGPDHLAGLLLAAIVAARSPRPALVVSFFAFGSLAGVLAIAPGEPFHLVETLVLASLGVLAGGAYFLKGDKKGSKGLLAAWLVFAAGAVHGLAYAGGIVGGEPAPLIAYLAGLLVVQTALGILIAIGARAGLAQLEGPAALD